MKKLIKNYLGSIGDGSMSKEEFFKTNNIIEDRLS
jgi:hypothetical protein